MSTAPPESDLMAVSSGTLTMVSHCTRCGRAVTIEYLPEITEHEPPLTPPSWQCPHWQCSGLNVVSGATGIVSVSKRYGPKPTP
jgi:hypothetical protein